MTDLISRAVSQQQTDTRPAYSAMQECLRLQSAAPSRGWFARLIGRTPLHPDARGWFGSALGERDLDHILAELGSNWTVFREAGDPVRPEKSRAEPPLTVIGPPGIFSVVARTFDARRVTAAGYLLTADGRESDGMRVALGDATRTGRLLAEASRARVEATPLLVVAGAASFRPGKEAPACDVVGLGQLRRWLIGRPRTVSDETIAYFSEIALRSGHWNRQPAVSSDVVRLVQRFERLQVEVRDARRRSRWALVVAALVLALAAVVVTTAALLP